MLIGDSHSGSHVRASAAGSRIGTPCGPCAIINLKTPVCRVSFRSGLAAHFPVTPHIDNHAKTVSMNGNFRRSQGAAIAPFSLLLVLLGFGAGERLCGKETELPNDFYIVSMVTSDASPFWYHY